MPSANNTNQPSKKFLFSLIIPIHISASTAINFFIEYLLKNGILWETEKA